MAFIHQRALEDETNGPKILVLNICKTVYKVDIVDILIKSKKGEEHKKKPLLLTMGFASFVGMKI